MLPQPPAREPTLVADDLGSVLREYMDVAGRLQRTHEALQGEVARLRRELALKDRELELRRRLAALGELAAGVAHEVRNPLGAIQLYSDLLRSQCQARELGPALRLIDKIEAGIQAIDAVVEDTLALAPRDRQLHGCNLQVVLAGLEEAAQRVLRAREVRLVVPTLPEKVLVLADDSGLQRVLVNLVNNAAEASEPGQAVELAVDVAPDAVRLTIDDHGLGLPDGIRERIFEPFFTTKENGTGLGLTIAFRLVEAFGGELAAENRPGGGARFTVTLRPARADDVQAGPDAAAECTSAA